MTPLMIKPGGHADIGRVSTLVGAAFHRLSAAGWLVPDPAERAIVLPATFAIIVEQAHHYGDIHIIDDGDGIVGAAVWLDYTSDVPEPWDYQTRLEAACGRWTDRFGRLDELFAAHHPSRPHHHMALLAVHPDRQRQGIGSALLAHHHAHLDRYAIAAYLEASGTDSRHLYLRHGYQPHGGPFDLADGARFWPMWRPPHPSDDPRGTQ